MFQLSIEFKDITHITKEKTARVFPNAIQISTKDEKHFISSLNARDKTYLILSQFWKSANAQEVLLYNDPFGLVKQRSEPNDEK